MRLEIKKGTVQDRIEYVQNALRGEKRKQRTSSYIEYLEKDLEKNQKELKRLNSFEEIKTCKLKTYLEQVNEDDLTTQTFGVNDIHFKLDWNEYKKLGGRSSVFPPQGVICRITSKYHFTSDQVDYICRYLNNLNKIDHFEFKHPDFNRIYHHNSP